MVIMRSLTPHPENPAWLQRRMDLRGDQILYNVVTDDIYVNGAGSFLTEDYRLPEKKTDEKREGGVPGMEGDLERPSQTLFKWEKSLYLNQKDRHVNLRQGVNMIHRSGNQLLKMKGLKTEEFGELETGRISNLRCEELDAWFDAPEKKRPTLKPDAGVSLVDAGPRFGPLKMFSATGEVVFREGPHTLSGERILYNGLTKMIEVYGYMKQDAVKKDAEYFRTDPRTGQRLQKVTPWFRFNTETERLEMDRIQGGGGM